jgi:hypothetical protein
MAVVRTIPDGAGRVVLLVVAHADDVPCSRCTVAAGSDAGWRVAVVWVTDDRTRSVASRRRPRSQRTTTVPAGGSDPRRRRDVELGYRTDALADISEVALRNRSSGRRLRPFAGRSTRRDTARTTRPPHGRTGDRRGVLDEPVRPAPPEHLAEGLMPHGCFERWYFGTPGRDPTDAGRHPCDLDRKIDAACEHVTMMTNYVNQLVRCRRNRRVGSPLARGGGRR